MEINSCGRIGVGDVCGCVGMVIGCFEKPVIETSPRLLYVRGDFVRNWRAAGHRNKKSKTNIVAPEKCAHTGKNGNRKTATFPILVNKS